MKRRAGPGKPVAGTTCSTAKDALAQCIFLLDGVYPLAPEADNDYVDALRRVVRFQIVELVNEFGSAAGPRVERVDQLITLLVGHRTRTASGEVGGLVGELRIALGLGPQFVNSIDDEQNVTNFRILTDYITSLQQVWIARSTRR